MRGHLYGEPEPREKCPYCATECTAEHCDIGVGMQQIEPFHCFSCGATEIGAYDEERERSPREQETGWYEPTEEGFEDDESSSGELLLLRWPGHGPDGVDGDSSTDTGLRDVRCDGHGREPGGADDASSHAQG